MIASKHLKGTEAIPELNQHIFYKLLNFFISALGCEEKMLILS